MNRLQGFHPDLCVLAGYMLIVGEEMCQRYNMINLHPAAPGGPTGTWQEVIWQLIDSKARGNRSNDAPGNPGAGQGAAGNLLYLPHQG